jgi:hypothetical protein
VIDPLVLMLLTGAGTAITGLAAVLYRELRSQITDARAQRDAALAVSKEQVEATTALTQIVREAIAAMPRRTGSR